MFGPTWLGDSDDDGSGDGYYDMIVTDCDDGVMMMLMMLMMVMMMMLMVTMVGDFDGDGDGDDDGDDECEMRWHKEGDSNDQD